MEECQCKRVIEAMEATSNSGTMMTKRRKLGFEEFNQSPSNSELVGNFPYRIMDLKDKSRAPASVQMSDELVDGDLARLRSSSDHIAAAYCLNTEASSRSIGDCVRSVDLEVKSFETENSASLNNNNFSRETAPVSIISENKSEMDSPVKKSKQNTSRRSPAVTMPWSTMAEIEDFFSKAEKYDQKLFVEKYNYDVVNDSPLEGRYEWICLKP